MRVKTHYLPPPIDGPLPQLSEGNLGLVLRAEHPHQVAHPTSSLLPTEQKELPFGARLDPEVVENIDGELHHLGKADEPQQLAGQNMFEAQTLAYGH
jgi:hypothetical protein